MKAFDAEPQALGPRISVVVPVLDEAARIERALKHLRELDGIYEIIVVDGGSSDRTPEIVARVPDVRLVESPCGRAKQMNAGAKLASGDVLLFLHADVALPKDAASHVVGALADPAVVAGAFRTWTVVDEHGTAGRPNGSSGRRSGPWPYLLHLADVRSRYTDLPYGDQAPFVPKEVFDALGGYPEIPLMEDLELSLRLRRAGKVRTVPASVRVSGRRFLERPVFYTFLVNVFPLLYRVGVSPETLASVYRHVR